MRIFIIVVFFVAFVSQAFANADGLMLSDAQEQKLEISEVNTQASLSENIERTKTQPLEFTDEEKTWLDGLNIKKEETIEEEVVDAPQLEDSGSLEGLIKEKKMSSPSRGKSNASVFDVSGVMLRMSVVQAENALRKRGYKKFSQNMQIPNFIKWRNEEKCRNSGVVGYERLEACVAKLSKQEKAQFIESAKYKKRETKEEVEIFMTSNYTGNKIFRVIYKTEVPVITGNSEKSTYLRNIKIYEFWRKINHKYGPPDDEENIEWSMGENKPFLKAETGSLFLEDPMLQELDWTRMSREDQKYINTDLYTF